MTKKIVRLKKFNINIKSVFVLNWNGVLGPRSA